MVAAVSETKALNTLDLTVSSTDFLKFLADETSFPSTFPEKVHSFRQYEQLESLEHAWCVGDPGFLPFRRFKEDYEIF
jgi:hypothetical protein